MKLYTIYSQNNKWNTLPAWHHDFGWARNVIKACEDRETARRLGREQWETACMDGWPFWVVRMPAYGSFHAFGSECSPANQIFGNLLWESSNWLNNNLLHKTKSTYQRSVDRSIVNLEYSMEKQGNNWSLNRKWPFKVFFIEEMLWQFCPHQKPVWLQFHL